MIEAIKSVLSLTSISQKEEEKKLQSQQQEECKNNSLSLLPHQPSKVKLMGVKKKEKNFLKRIFRLSPTLKQNHIFKLCGYVGINQKAIQDPDFQESLLVSYFACRVIEKVEIYTYAIVICMAEPAVPQYQLPVEYMIEKYRSKGDAKYYQLSSAMYQLSQLFKQAPMKPPVQQKTDSITKWFDSMGDQMYIICLTCRKFAISKALLTYLEYDAHEFTIQATKYRTIFSEFYQAMNYGNQLKHLINCFKYKVKFSRSEISWEQFKQLTTYTYNGFIRSKNNVRSYCNMTMSFINPSFLIFHKVNFIYYKQGEANIKFQNNAQMTMAIEDEKERIRQAQYTILNKLKPLPKHLMKKNQKLFASYKEKPLVSLVKKEQMTDQ